MNLWQWLKGEPKPPARIFPEVSPRELAEFLNHVTGSNNPVRNKAAIVSNAQTFAGFPEDAKRIIWNLTRALETQRGIQPRWPLADPVRLEETDFAQGMDLPFVPEHLHLTLVERD